jgi:hypothetical protein
MPTEKLIRADARWKEECVRYSICTLVTNPAEYAQMVESFRAGGFLEPDCEFLHLDNTRGNAFDAYSGNNLFLNVARGQFIILCHQDVQLIEDGRENLDNALANLTRLDPNWAACGNAGGEYVGRLAIRITDAQGVDQKIGHFPANVQSLDENFIVVRRSANLALSHDLKGFHLYGADLCIMADILGRSCYVIDFHLLHKSGGVIDKSFSEVRERLICKYRRAFRSRWIQATCTRLFVSGNPILGSLRSTVATRIARPVVCSVAWLVHIFRSSSAASRRKNE